MKVTIENYKRCGDKPNYLYSLLIDLAELNRLIEKANIIICILMKKILISTLL